MAVIKVNRTPRKSRGSMMTGLARAEMKVDSMPYIHTIHDRAATNMVKLMACRAEVAASLSEAITLPMRAVMSSVQKSAMPRRMRLMKPDMLTVVLG